MNLDEKKKKKHIIKIRNLNYAYITEITMPAEDALLINPNIKSVEDV